MYRMEHPPPSIKHRAMLNDYLRFGGVITSLPPRLRRAHCHRRRNPSSRADGSSDEEFESAAAANRDPAILDEAFGRGELHVGFANVAELWLGVRFVKCNKFPEEECFRDAAGVVTAFLRFLVEKGVCPEHRGDMEEAMHVAERAGRELPRCKVLMLGLPGKFNKACAIEFGGDLYGIFKGFNDDLELKEMIGISEREVKELVKDLKDGKMREDSRKSMIAVQMKVTAIEGLETNGYAKTSNDIKNTITSQDMDPHTEDRHDARVGPTPNTALNSCARTTLSAPNLCILRLCDFNKKHSRPISVLLERDLAHHFLPDMSVTASFHPLPGGEEMWYLSEVEHVLPTFHRMEEWEVECEEEEEDDVLKRSG